MIKEILQMEEELVRQIDELKGDDRPSARLRRRQLESDRQELLATCKTYRDIYDSQMGEEDEQHG